MKYLNLTKGFNPYNARDEDLIKFESFTFSGGEPHIKLQAETYYFTDVKISIKLNSFNDVGLLMVAVDALRRMATKYKWSVRIELLIPYFPGARQDRVMAHGESLTVKVYADLINSLNLDLVHILDPHSDVAPALINNVAIISNYEIIKKVLKLDGALDEPCEIQLVSPDAGSNKKMKDLVLQLSINHPDHDFKVIRCDKTRDVKTGILTGFTIIDEVDNAPLIIIDDICDGGGTFIGLAKELKKKTDYNISLAVTHGIFSKGFKELNNLFDGIYTTDSFWNVKQGEDIKYYEDKLNVIKLKEILYEF